MITEREQYFRKDCGAAARNIFPNEFTHIHNFPESQTVSAVPHVPAESARVANPPTVETWGHNCAASTSAAHTQSHKTCTQCNGTGENAHFALCSACFGTGIIF